MQSGERIGIETTPARGTLVIRLAGSWRAADGGAPFGEIESRIAANASVRGIEFDATALKAWDTGILPFLMRLSALAAERGIAIDPLGLPTGVQRLFRLAIAVPERKGARRSVGAIPFLVKTGEETIRLGRQLGDMVGFLGETTIGIWRLARGRANYRRADLVNLIQSCGAEALPIVSLISLLVGLILAFVGAVQLRQFGAQIYVADLVGIAMVREMGAMMTGIIMAGRTGAAFAAQIGTMEVNEEIDALKTFGFSPIDFLVTPRVLALVIMMPVLCLYADFLGILGGALVGVTMLDITVVQYVNQTREALSLTDFAVGIFKGSVFGVLIALAGCLRGMQCGRSASAVGDAATSAVVTAILFIVVTDGAFAVITDILGI